MFDAGLNFLVNLVLVLIVPPFAALVAFSFAAVLALYGALQAAGELSTRPLRGPEVQRYFCTILLPDFFIAMLVSNISVTNNLPTS